MKKGQYIRLLLATTTDPTTVIAAAKTMALHGSAATEDSSTKDTTGDYIENEVTGLSYDISGSGLVLTTTDALNTGAVSANGIVVITMMENFGDSNWDAITTNTRNVAYPMAA